MARAKRLRLSIAGDDGTAMFASAASLLDWKVVAAAGIGAAAVRDETRAKIVELDRVIDAIDADIAVVGTPPERRSEDVRRLLQRGVAVVLIPHPDVSFRPGPEEAGDKSASWVVGAPIVMAPAVQRWMQVLQSIDTADRVWITATSPLTTSACALAVVTARLLESASADSIDITIVEQSDALPRFDAQASGPDDAATLTLFPDALVEHNGNDASPPASRHPADVFGATDLLRRFADDLATNTTPILGADFLRDVQARQENL